MAVAPPQEKVEMIVSRVEKALTANRTENESVGFSISAENVRRVNGYWYAFLKRTDSQIRRVQVWDLLADVEAQVNALDEKPYIHIAEDLAD